jgi:hypothetical protein
MAAISNAQIVIMWLMVGMTLAGLCGQYFLHIKPTPARHALFCFLLGLAFSAGLPLIP